MIPFAFWNERCSILAIPLMFVIYALYPFQWSLIGIHGVLESFELVPHIALLSIAQIHDRIPNIKLNAHTI